MSLTHQILFRFAILSFFIYSSLNDSMNLIAEEKTNHESVKIFNGKDFEGWEGNLDYFNIKDGAIVAGSTEKRIPNNEFLCTKKSYSNFELTLQAKLTGQGKNAGIQFRSQRIPNHHEVIGYQCDMGVMKDRLIWGSLYDESRRRTFLAHGDNEKLKKVFKADDWNDLKIVCDGPQIKIWVNGIQTVDYLEEDNKIANFGIIGLQIHSGPPAEAAYRQIKIKELK